MFTPDEMKAFAENLGAGTRTIGTRKARIKCLLADLVFVPCILLLWVTSAPHRFMSHWLLGVSQLMVPGQVAKEQRTAFPPICDLVNATMSPVTLTQQFNGKIILRGSEWQQSPGTILVIRPETCVQIQHSRCFAGLTSPA